VNAHWLAAGLSAMTIEEQDRHLAARRDCAAQLIATPHRYKVCDQCESISTKRMGICGLCGTYRFNENPSMVRQIASEISEYPFPLTLGIAPRF
jgi:hypothetical protein